MPELAVPLSSKSEDLQVLNLVQHFRLGFKPMESSFAHYQIAFAVRPKNEIFVATKYFCNIVTLLSLRVHPSKLARSKGRKTHATPCCLKLGVYVRFSTYETFIAWLEGGFGAKDVTVPTDFPVLDWLPTYNQRAIFL